MSVQRLLKERRSTRHFDKDYDISQQQIKNLLQIATLSPSGNNSQPWRFVVITQPHLRDILLPIAYNQEQILTASAIILILADTHAYQAKNLIDIHESEYQDGCFNADIRDFLTQAAIGFYQNYDDVQIAKFFGLDVGMVAMSIMLTALEMGYHSVPMTGYDPIALRDAFCIDDRYMDMMMIAIGKGIADGHRTLRHHIDDIVRFNKFYQHKD